MSADARDRPLGESKCWWRRDEFGAATKCNFMTPPRKKRKLT